MAGCGGNCTCRERRIVSKEGSEKYALPVVNELQDNAKGTPTAEEVIEYIRSFRANKTQCGCKENLDD